MRRRFTACLRSATLKAEATLGHLKSGGPAFEMTTSLPPTFVFSRSMSGRTLRNRPMLDRCLHQRFGCPSTGASRGIATALLRRVFWEFRHRGVKHVDLKVQLDNPTGAVRLYKELGMREIALDGS